MKEHAHARRAHAGHSDPPPQDLFRQGAFSALIPELKQAVAAEGYVTPTPIQEQCISQLLDGRDLMGSAQTGTGKTAAFALPLLQRLAENTRRPRKGPPRALILAPTRELAAQIGESIQTYGRFLRLGCTVVFGGVNQFHQVKALNRGVHILVATPGRLLDLMQQGFIHLDEVEVFILDEMDRRLDMGFIPDIKRVLSHIPSERQTLFFSATIPPKMEVLAHTMVCNPVRVSIAPDKPTVERIVQKVLFVEKRDKDALLASLLKDSRIKKALVFTQMKHSANRVVKKLSAAGIHGTAIHGNKSQAARTKALGDFKRGSFRVLVATDVAARGLDMDDITHVINYDLPVEAETYVHRIGRTARMDAGGDAISFCCAQERAYLVEIERLLGMPVPPEMEHAYHCDEAFRSSQPAPKTHASKKPGPKKPAPKTSGRGSVRGRQGGRSQPKFAGRRGRSRNRGGR
jgi:ATP-dependent RNA helicase RhlE